SGRAKFPGGREKCREFRRLSRFLQKFVSETPANTIVCERIPCAVEQGIFSRVQGISSAFWTGAGNLGKIDPRFGAQQRRILPANTRKDATTFLASDPRAARTASPLTSSPHRIPMVGYRRTASDASARGGEG